MNRKSLALLSILMIPLVEAYSLKPPKWVENIGKGASDFVGKLSQGTLDVIAEAGESFKDSSKTLGQQAEHWWSQIEHSPQAASAELARAAQEVQNYSQKVGDIATQTYAVYQKFEQEKAKLEQSYKELKSRVGVASQTLDDLEKAYRDPQWGLEELYHRYGAKQVEQVAEDTVGDPLGYRSWNTYESMIRSEEEGGWTVIWSPSYSWNDMVAMVISGGTWGEVLIERTKERMNQNFDEAIENHPAFNKQKILNSVYSVLFNSLTKKKLVIPGIESGFVVGQTSYSDHTEIIGVSAKTMEYYRFFFKFKLDLPPGMSPEDMEEMIDAEINKKVEDAGLDQITVESAYSKLYNRKPDHKELYQALTYMNNLNSGSSSLFDKAIHGKALFRSLSDESMNLLQNLFWDVWHQVPSDSQVERLQDLLSEGYSLEEIREKELQRRAAVVVTVINSTILN